MLLKTILTRTCLSRNVRNINSSNMIKRESMILDLDKKPSNCNNNSSSNRSNENTKKKLRWSAGSVAMLIIPGFAFSLGCWQVYRLDWKLKLIDQLKSKLDEPAKPLPAVLSREFIEDNEYCRFHIKGEFLHDQSFIINPRGRFDPGVKASASSGSLLSENDMSSHGGHLITPFRLFGTRNVILINRGWIPSFMFDAEAREKTNPKGVVELDAILRNSEQRPQFVGQNVPEQGVWYYRDLVQMANTYGTLPVWLDAAYETTLPGGPIGGQTNINVRNEHLNYLLTWYSLTIVTLLMWLHKFRR